MATKSATPPETKAHYEARLAAAKKYLTETISKQDGNPDDLTWKDVTVAFHLFGTMDAKARQNYLRHHMYSHLVNDCLIDPSGNHSLDFFSAEGVVKELAKEAMLPPERRAGHQLALPGSVDQELKLIGPEGQNPSLCKAAIASEIMLMEQVADHAPPAATPAQGKSAATHKDTKAPGGH